MDDYTIPESAAPDVSAAVVVSRRPPFWLIAAWLTIAIAAWPVLQREAARRNEVPLDDLTRSQGFFQNGHFPEAIAAAQLYLQRKPDSADALVNIGISYANMGKWDDAVAATQRALAIRPDFPLAWNNLRWILASRSATHPPAEAWQGQALSLYQAGDFAGCADRATKALALYPQYTKALNLLSVCELNLGRVDDAIRNAREATRLEPAFQLARNNLNLALQEKAKRTAPAFTPTPATDVLLNSSLQNYRSGRLQECINDARAALKLNPGLAVAYNNIAACSNDLGRPDDAVTAAVQALRLQPDFQLARNNLAVALQLKDRQESSRKQGVRQ